MKVVVMGASGNVGTSVLAALARSPEVDEVLGLARRVPSLDLPKVSWAHADVVSSDLTRLFAGADAVVHLAWLIQPARDQRTVRAVNVEGSARVLRAVAAAGVPTLVHASSVGAYSPGPKDRRVDESWPTQGIETSYYSVQKAEVERLLDRFEGESPGTRVVRLRPGLIFKHEAASEIRRYFIGPFLPNPLVRRSLVWAVPDVRRLAFQAVHSHDVGDAYALAVTNAGARGSFNLAAEPVLDPPALAQLLQARRVRVPARALRMAASATWRARLQPASPGWLDMALGVPLMDTRRAREELGWEPRHSSERALLDLIEGLRRGGDYPTPPLERGAGGPLRIRELLTGVGSRQGLR